MSNEEKAKAIAKAISNQMIISPLTLRMVEAVIERKLDVLFKKEDKPYIRIDISGGIANVAECNGVEWEIRDYDIQGDEDDIEIDEDGNEYVNY